MNDNLQAVDFRFFEENKSKLYEEYGHKYLAIKNKTVLGAFDTFDAAVKGALKSEQLGTFIIQECVNNDTDCMQVFQNIIFPAGNLSA
jgi:hypothetical protein